MQFTAKTFEGLENVLASELEENGAQDIRILKKGVQFSGNIETMYRVNYNSRTALKVLWEISSFNAEDAEHLYKKAKRIEWEKYMSSENTFAIDKSVVSKDFSHGQYAALRVKDAIADYFKEKFDRRPSVNTDKPEIKVSVQINGKIVSIALDTSGEPLFKRGYRKSSGSAPLNEIFAAGIVLLSDYKTAKKFYDPMCGSGTILIEAARIFLNIPPAYSRKEFGFLYHKNFDKQTWEKVKSEADSKIKTICDVEIIGSDIDTQVIFSAKKNIVEAGLKQHIALRKINFFNSEAPVNKGLLITNPPYDTRIKSNDIIFFYNKIGKTLQEKYQNWDASIFSGNAEAIGEIKIKPKHSYSMLNGDIKTILAKYEIPE